MNKLNITKAVLLVVTLGVSITVSAVPLPPNSRPSLAAVSDVKIVQANQATKGLNTTNVAVVKTEQEAKAMKAQWAAEGKTGTIVVAKDAKEAATAVSNIIGSASAGDKATVAAVVAAAAAKAFPDAAASITTAAVSAAPDAAQSIANAVVSAGGNKEAVTQAAVTAVIANQPPPVAVSEGKSESNTNTVALKSSVIVTALAEKLSGCGTDTACQQREALAALKSAGSDTSFLSTLASAIAINAQETGRTALAKTAEQCAGNTASCT